MSLRIVSGKMSAADPDPPDGWAARLAKLIPAEALGLYGAGSALVPDDKVVGLWILAAACLVFAGALRYVATQDDAGKPQIIAVVLALISFVLWVVALQPPSGPVDLGDNAYLGGLAALLWGTIVPAFYKGER